MPTILDLPALVGALSGELRAACDTMFSVVTATGTLVLPETMLEWTAQQFGAVEIVRQQTVIKVVNQFTLEGALFNPSRARRPAIGRSSDAAIEAWVAEELRNDIFAVPNRTTPADLFGRIRGSYCETASNIAKYDGWHGVVICDEPHPLRFTQAQVQDYIETAWRWIEAAHAYDPQAIYPIITWNCMPKSGASLAHGHLQVALGAAVPYTRIEAWRRAAQAYRAQTQREYFADLSAIHSALGLQLPAVAGMARFAHVTPARNLEVVLLQETQPTHQPDLLALANAIYQTLASMLTRHATRAFNLAIAFPPLGSDHLDWRGVPVFARIGDRGDPLAVRSDVGVMELYGMSVITADPFSLVETQ